MVKNQGLLLAKHGNIFDVVTMATGHRQIRKLCNFWVAFVTVLQVLRILLFWDIGKNFLEI